MEALEEVAASALEMLSSMRLIRTFSKEGAEKARFGSQVRALSCVCSRWRVSVSARALVFILSLPPPLPTV